MKQNKIYFILTTGRSGNSLFVKFLETLGLKVPDPLRINKLFSRLINKYNPKGFLKILMFFKLMKKILFPINLHGLQLKKKFQKNLKKSFEKKINNVFSKFSNLN